MISPEKLIMGAMPSMNDTHLDDMILINKLSKAAHADDEKAVSEAFTELVAHTEEHFEGEEKMMLKEEFPPYPHHKEEHDIALRELKAMAQNFEENKSMKEAILYVDTILSPWFLKHVELLDGVTAMFLADPVEHRRRWRNLRS